MLKTEKAGRQRTEQVHAALRALLGVGLVALFAESALAIDGVTEINQARAIAGGVTASDTPGFPVTLDTAGSYRLTGSLTVPDLNTSGVVIASNRVHFDLNGFSISGPGGGTGTGSGISTAGSLTGIWVGNGFVSGMGDAGCWLGSDAFVERVIASGNGGDGIAARRLSSVIANSNGNRGLLGVRIQQCVADQNGIGIGVETGIVADCSLHENGIGIDAIFSPVIRGNEIAFSDTYGIRMTNFGGLITQNVVTHTENGDGIYIDPYFPPGLDARVSLVRDNVSAGNGRTGGSGAGIRLVDQAILVNNATSDNASEGIVGANHISVIESQAVANGASGISLGTDSLLVSNTTDDNANQGVLTGRQAVLINGQSSGNGGTGIEVGRDALVRDSLSFGNTGDGIRAGTSATVIGNNTNENTSDGIYAGTASLITDNASSTNGTGSTGNGIHADPDSNVSRNVARSNKASGLEASTSDVGYSNNVFGNNPGGDVQSGTDLGGNMCGGTPGC